MPSLPDSYLRQMKSLELSMSVNEYTQFTEKGYFTVRRTNRFWSGNFTDQTIEQDLMRLFRLSGGMTRGRGITESTLTKWTHSFPQYISICEGLEKFANIHTPHLNNTKTSEQSNS